MSTRDQPLTPGSMDSEDRSPSLLKPVLVLSKFPGDSSFQTTPMEAYSNFTAADVARLPKWEDKTDNRLFWRGSSTGGYNKQRDWKESHRLRLHLMVNGPKGGDAWWAKEVRDVMIPQGESGYQVVRRWERVLSKAYADVKLAGTPVQVGHRSELEGWLQKETEGWIDQTCSAQHRNSAKKWATRSSLDKKSGRKRQSRSSTISMSTGTGGRPASTGC
jgi:hypothetical protein